MTIKAFSYFKFEFLEILVTINIVHHLMFEF